MRRKQRKTNEESALALLGRAPEHHLATCTVEGKPVLRCLNGVLVDDWVLFHGAIAGEKSDCLGQAAVVSAHEVVADIPSYFVDGVKACPATTFYRSVQVRGVLENVESTELKAQMLQALMEKLQPEGGHVPIAATESLYAKDLRAVRVFGLRIEEVSGKASLGQEKPPEFVARVVEGLWRRGKERDLRAIEEILSLSPDARPARWRVGDSATLHMHPTAEDIARHTELLEPEYWRDGCSREAIRHSIERSAAWVGVRTASGELVAGARAQGDGAWAATIYDVVVDPAWRGRGLGRAVMEALLDHPLVRGCHRQRLGTQDAQEFYASLGFVEAERLAPSFPHTLMARQGNGSVK